MIFYHFECSRRGPVFDPSCPKHNNYMLRRDIYRERERNNVFARIRYAGDVHANDWHRLRMQHHRTVPFRQFLCTFECVQEWSKADHGKATSIFFFIIIIISCVCFGKQYTFANICRSLSRRRRSSWKQNGKITTHWLQCVRLYCRLICANASI